MQDTLASPDPRVTASPTWGIEAVTPATLQEASVFVNASRRTLFPSLGSDALLDHPTVLETSCVLVARAANLTTTGNNGHIVAAIAYIPFDYRFPQLPPPIGSFSTPPSTANSSTSSLNTPVHYFEKPCRIVEVLRLFVLPQYRRHGLAASLFRSLQDHAVASRVQCMYLHTHPFLPGAIRFWEKQGFDIVGVDEEDEVWQTHHMQMMLEPAETRTQHQETPSRAGD
ncbi:uncharacterized protein M421DRAFT_419192 [Didymella exigua CBS 183.55]|uniref:N-acetyltransferase domain-containing protein n=1 Tax=Didymella exigua CBS 183.55 TaxID=1150837 RepID=A0A6A5RP38_9PLEO|nr:uncharacterized protein M421DRAFT_419192 [Didymella exigua CBS 183.55]KAF1930155.1 hypothetical protein M421DRAFT_419192 [Didymella exigua CBS 183.55]